MKELAHLAEFQAILQNPEHKYQPSKESQAIVRQTSIALFVGPTNAGRNTIINKLIPRGKYYFIISDTTRVPRMRNGRVEQNGIEYWFRKETAVLKDLAAGRFVEAAIIHEIQVSGISVREIAAAEVQSKVAVTDIEIVGVHSVRAIKKDTMCIFVLPPSFEAWQKRLQKRGDIKGQDLLKRMESATKEYKEALDHPYYWFVVNNNLDKAVEYAEQIITNQKADPAKQAAGRHLAEELLQETTRFLEKQSWEN